LPSSCTLTSPSPTPGRTDAQIQILVIPAGLDSWRESPFAFLRGGAAEAGWNEKVAERLIHRTTEVVQRLLDITNEHGIEHSIHLIVLVFRPQRPAKP
jgi:hypothetical protein